MIVSIFGIGGIIGGLLGGPMTAAVGPRMTMLGNNLIWIASGLCQVRQSKSVKLPTLIGYTCRDIVCKE
jgi:predicted MFS family arabinose efflux permease